MTTNKAATEERTANPAARTFCMYVERGDGVAPGTELIEIPELTTLSAVDHLVSVAAGRRPGTVLLEPSFAGPTPQLIATALRPNWPLFVNGAEMGPTHALEVGDVVTDDACELRLHVSLRYRPHVGPAQPEHVGRTCPVCLTQIEGPQADQPATTVVVCTACDAVLHEAGRLGEGEAAEVLECARTVSNCPVCGTALVRAERMAYVPETD